MEIKSLDELIINKNKKHYIYKNIDFYTNIEKVEKLIVIFHGGRCGAKIPIFRGYDYYIDNSNILSISDPLYKYYDNINIGWYFNTKKTPFICNNIIKIIKKIKKIGNSKTILFVAQCAGSLIATKLSCIFNEYLLITNPHLILKADDITPYYHWSDKAIKNKYYLRSDNRKVPILHSILLDDNNDLLDYDDLDIRKIIKKYNLPKKMYIISHKDDYTAEYIKAVNKYINNNKICNVYLHDTKCKIPHHCPFPPGKKLLDYIINYSYFILNE